MSQRRNNKRIPGWAGNILSALFWLGLWLLAYRAVGQDFLLASPMQVLRKLMALAGTGRFWQNVLGSVGRTMTAYLLGVSVGALLAVATSMSGLLYALFRPALRIIEATPVASFIILALVWLGKGRVPVLAGFVMVLPIIWANVSEGIASTDGQLLEMARTYAFGRRKTLAHVYIPSVLPTFIAACSTAIGLCWKATIAAEVLGVPARAIGTQLYNAKIYLETDTLLAWTAMVILLSVGLEKLFMLGLKRIPLARGSGHDRI